MLGSKQLPEDTSFKNEIKCSLKLWGDECARKLHSARRNGQSMRENGQQAAKEARDRPRVLMHVHLLVNKRSMRPRMDCNVRSQKVVQKNLLTTIE